MQPTASPVTPVILQNQRTPTVQAALVGTPGTLITAINPATLRSVVTSIEVANALETVRQLSSDTLEGRRAGQRGADLAARYIADQYQAVGLQPWRVLGISDYYQRFPIPSSGESSNVIGIVPGSASPNSFVLLIAHYDSRGRDANGTLFRGADFNASGVAGLIEIAHAIKKAQVQPRESLVFAALTGEASDRLGARTLAKRMQEVDVLTRSVVIELLALGPTGGDFGDVWDQGVRENEVIVDRVLKAARYLGYKMRRNGTNTSVHSSVFTTTYKIPAISVSWAYSEGEGAVYHPHLRAVTDTPAQIDKQAFEMALKLSATGAWVIANDS